MKASSSITITNLLDGLATWYQYAKADTNTTAPTTGWSSTMPPHEAGKFIWRREGIALTAQLVNSWGNVMCLTGATGPIGGEGEQGEPALYYVDLVTNDNLNTKITPRTVYSSPSTAVCASLQNVPSGFVAGECKLEVHTLGSDNYLIQYLYCKAGTVSKQFSRTYHTGSFSSWVELGRNTRETLGMITSYPLPTNISGKSILAGDYFLWGGSTINPNVHSDVPYGLIKGEVYEYTGAVWQKTTNKNLVMSLLGDFIGISNDVDEAVMGNVIIKDLVAINAFIKNLTTERLEAGGGLMAGGLSFTVLPDGYSDGTNDYALIEIRTADNDTLFSVDGKRKELSLVGGGTWVGMLLVKNDGGNTLLETTAYRTGASVTIPTFSKTLWSFEELKAKAAVNALPQTATGSYNGKTISKACYRANAGKFVYQTASRSVNSGSNYQSETTATILTLPSIPGAEKVAISISGNVWVRKNGTQVSGTQNYSSGDVYTVCTKADYWYETEYKYDYDKYVAVKVGNDLYWQPTDSGTTGWSTWQRDTGDLPDPSYEGQKVTVYWNEQTQDILHTSSNSGTATISIESANSHPAGITMLMTDNTYATFPYMSGYVSGNHITLNSWSSASNLKYISGTDIYNHFSTYILGREYAVDPTSKLTSYQEAGGTNNPLNSFTSFRVSANNVEFLTSSVQRIVNRFGGNGSSVGVYSALAGSYLFVDEVDGIKTATLTPVGTATVGTSANPYSNGNFTNLTVNNNITASGNITGNQVYGAVFN